MLVQNPILINPHRLKKAVEEAVQKSLKEAPDTSAFHESSPITLTARQGIIHYPNVEYILPAVIRLFPQPGVVMKYLLIQTKKITRTTCIILTTCTWLVLSLFATNRRVRTAYPWQLFNNSETISSYE